MKHDFKTYLILLVVFSLSFGAAFFFAGQEVIRTLLAAPGILALMSALFQLMRDEAAYEKKLQLQSNQLRFTLGAASHMAAKAFDKHAEFCEEYMKEVHSTALTLIREGDTPKALNHAGSLHQVRQNYAVWLTDEIDEKLQDFESKIRTLGANAQFIETTNEAPQHAETRGKMIWSNHELLLDILNVEDGREKKDESVEDVKRKVRKILGIEHLTELRDLLVEEASEAMTASLNKKL